MFVVRRLKLRFRHGTPGKARHARVLVGINAQHTLSQPVVVLAVFPLRMAGIGRSVAGHRTVDHGDLPLVELRRDRVLRRCHVGPFGNDHHVARVVRALQVFDGNDIPGEGLAQLVNLFESVAGSNGVMVTPGSRPMRTEPLLEIIARVAIAVL